MEGARAAVVSGVERREQFAHLLAAALPYDEPVGTHAQGLTHEPCEPDRAGPLEVRLPGLEAKVVGMVDPQLGDVLDRDDALAVRSGCEQGRPAAWSCPRPPLP